MMGNWRVAGALWLGLGGGCTWATAAGAQGGPVKTVRPPSRDVRIVSETEFCLDLPKSAKRTACLGSAADTLISGLDYQSCLWGLDANLKGCEPGDPPSDPVVANSLIDQGRKFAEELRLDQVTPEHLHALQELAADYVRITRGRYTLVSQGGVSLGSWQSGYVYFLTEVLKHRRDKHAGKGESAFTTLAGASAGAINAIAAGLQGCGDYSKDQTPEDSLFYKVWVKTLKLSGEAGKETEGLLPREETCAEGKQGGECLDRKQHEHLALFSMKPLDAAMKLAGREFPGTGAKGCNFQYGLSVTHLKPVPVPVAVDGETVDVKASRLGEYFSFRVTPNADEGTPTFENLESRETKKPLTSRLRNDGIEAKRDAEITTGTFLNAVRASGAFPVAFPPVELNYDYKSGASWKPSKPRLFVDGGTLDNAPIGLAASMNDWSESSVPNPWLVDLLPLPDNYYLVDPNVVSWERAEKTKEEKKAEDDGELLGTYLKFAGKLFGAGSQAQMVSAVRELDWLGSNEQGAQPRVEVPRRNLPIAGEQLGHFMAFLEEDFRVFDFYSGIWDAAVHLGDKKRCEADKSAGRLGKRCELLDSEDQVRRDLIASSWQLKCLEKYSETLAFDAVESGRRIESGSELPQECRFAPEEKVEKRNFQAMLTAMHNYKLWEMSAYSEKDAFGVFFAELGSSHFEYRSKEMSKGRREGDSAEFTFRTEIAERAVSRLAGRHTGIWVPQLLVSGGRVASDIQFTRTFDKFGWGVGYALNGLEGIALWGIGEATPTETWRLGIRPRVYRMGFRSLTPSRSVWATSTSLFAGLVVTKDVLAKKMPGVLDLELWAGATGSAVHLGTTDGWFAQRQFGPSVGLTAVLLRKLYVGLDADWFLPDWITTRSRFEGETTLGNYGSYGQIRIGASVGWRFQH